MDLRINTRTGSGVGRAGTVLRGGLMALAGAALLAGNVAGGCSSNNPSQISVPLDYRPNGTDAMPIVRIPTNGAVKLFVAPTTDKRSDPASIGRNTEDSDKPIPVLAAGRPPAEFVTDVIRQEAGGTGVEMALDAAAADRTLETEIVEFLVTEDNTYQAQVRLKARLVDRGGRPLWQGIVAGGGANFGKSKNVMNYQQTLSNATREAVGRLLGDAGFATAMSAPVAPTVTPPAPPAPPAPPVVPAPAPVPPPAPVVPAPAPVPAPTTAPSP